MDAVHLKLHPFKCDVCNDKKFALKETLARHIKTVHCKEKTHTCNECDKEFIQKSHFTAHYSAVHLKLRPFKCEVCGSAYAEKSTLTKHTKTHMK